MSTLICPDCGRERGEHACQGWMDCMNNMRGQLRDNKAALAERDKRIKELEAELRVAWEDDCNCAPNHMHDCPAYRPPNQQPKEET